MSERNPVTWDQPSHPSLIDVSSGTEPFSTRAISLQDHAPGSVLCKITAFTPTTTRTYATVQRSRTEDIDLLSDLVFLNHSCDPNVVLDMRRMEVRVVEGKRVKTGDELTFFYPSTEWEMARPFGCTCGAEGKCIGLVKGAKFLDKQVLARYWLNSHILELLRSGKEGYDR